MLPLVEIPEHIRHYAPWFASVFSPEACVQLQRDVSRLIVSEHKAIDGIYRLLVLEVVGAGSIGLHRAARMRVNNGDEMTCILIMIPVFESSLWLSATVE